jgi:hypothetical protein
MQLDKQDVVDLLRKEGKNEHVQKPSRSSPTRSTTSSTRKCSSGSESTQASWPTRRSRKNFASSQGRRADLARRPD